MYRIAGISGGIKIWWIAIFCVWRILIWRIGRHVSLSMRTVNEKMVDLILANGEKIAKFTKINSLQIARYMVHVY